jgi:putative glutamine amidotransferase
LFSILFIGVMRYLQGSVFVLSALVATVANAGVSSDVNKPKIIGITVSSEVVDDGANPEDDSTYWVEQGYIDAINRSCGDINVVAVAIPNSTDNLQKYVAMADGIIFTSNQKDLDPAMYGEVKSKHSKIQVDDTNRSDFELALAKMYVNTNKPILAISTGMHVLNVAMGGGIKQDISSKIDHQCGYKKYHNATLIANTKLHGLADGKTNIGVNSLHRAALGKIADGLFISATSSDGNVEAVEGKNKDRYIVGVQWSPQFAKDALSNNVIRSFCMAVVNGK